MLALLGLLGCSPAVVQFDCGQGAPFCDTLAVLQDPRELATGIDVSGISVNGVVEQPLVEDGEVSSDDRVPLIGGKDALVRVFVTQLDDFVPRTLTGRLYIYKDSELYAAYQTDLDVSAASEWSNLSSSFNFHVAGELLDGDLSFTAEIDEAAGVTGSETPGTPSFGPVDTTFESVGRSVRVVVVPVAYEADGSGRLPDTSDEQLETYRQYMSWMYPAPEVEISLGTQISSEAEVSASGSGWDQLLADLAESRTDQGVDEDVYLFGAFDPTEDWNSFCGGGCVAGLSNMAMTAADSFSRSSIGLGFTGTEAAVTMAHEVGHAHGRNHSPGCGAAGADEDYPNTDGLLDYRNYDAINDVLLEADTTYDIMSYCTPYGVSAFTFSALAERVAEVNELYGGGKTERVERHTWKAVWVHSDGTLQWGGDRVERGVPGGDTVPIELLAETGKVLARTEAIFSPFSDLPGGSLVFPDPGYPVAKVRYEGETTELRGTGRFGR